MKRILIIEDEQPAAKRLSKLIHALSDDIEIVAVIDSIEDAVAWFKSFPEPDLAFFDIQLADGLSFSIFEQVSIQCPVIFTTAYDQYAIQAFKVNSIDYLLKPIDHLDLDAAWQKFQSLQQNNLGNISALVASFQKANQQKNFKERFLIKKGEQYEYLTIDTVAYFFSENGITFLINKEGKRFMIDDKLDTLVTKLNPHHFFRVNRKFIIGEAAVSKIASYFNSRLKLELNPPAKEDIIVARERASEFKDWLNA